MTAERWEPDRSTPPNPWPMPTLVTAIGRGLRGHCPACGKGRIFDGFLTVAVAVANPADRPYVLQVGAFRDTKPAKDLQADLLKKGYSTTIYNMVDEDLRNWHMVRFGGYKDVSTASKAASDFTAKEGVQALVKRFDAL